MARAIVSHFPVSFISFLGTAEWHGGHLIDLPDSEGIRTPSAKEISKHFVFIKPVVKQIPSKASP